MLGTAYQTLVSRLGEVLSEAGIHLSVPEYMILRVLYTRDGLQQCEISEVVGKDKGAVSRCIRNMERRGLVRTETVSHKCVKVYLAEAGRKIEWPVMNVARQRHEALLRLLTHDEITVLHRALKIIIEQPN